MDKVSVDSLPHHFMKNKQNTQTSMKFHFVNPAQGSDAPAEKGTVTITIDSASPNPHEMVADDGSFEEAAIEFLKDQLCIEGGVVLSEEMFNVIQK